MIKLNTILSSFDDKATLLKWLKKVEKALAESVLESITAVNVTATTKKLVFHFADESTIETPAFTVKGDKGDTGATGQRGPQGPAGQDGADGTDGTDGKDALYIKEILEVDALDSYFDINISKFNRTPLLNEDFYFINKDTPNNDEVQIISARVSLITNNVVSVVRTDDVLVISGPQGPQGQQGPQGPAGSDAEVNAENLLNVLQGSETIVVDEAEDGEHVEVHIDADILTKINRALLTPLSTPAQKQIAGVGTNGEQVMFNIGEGLEIVGSTSPFLIQRKKPVELQDISTLNEGDLVLIKYISNDFGNAFAVGIVEYIDDNKDNCTISTTLQIVDHDTDREIIITSIDTGRTFETDTLTFSNVLGTEIEVSINDTVEFYKL